MYSVRPHLGTSRSCQTTSSSRPTTPAQRPEAGCVSARLEHPLVVRELDEIWPAPLGLQLGVRVERSEEERLEVRGEGSVHTFLGLQGSVMLHVHRQVPMVRRARVEGVGPDEEIGFSGAVGCLIDGQPAPDHQRDSALHGAERRCLPRTSGEIAVDDDRIGDGRCEQPEDPGLEVDALLAQHRHERGAG